MRQNKKNKGFTLVELLIVVAIIGILAAVLTPQFLNARKVAVDKAAEAYVSNVYTSVQAYIAQTGEMPTETDCDGGYNPGSGNSSYPVADPKITPDATGSNEGCVVSGDIDDVAVTFDYTGGVTNKAVRP